MEMFLATKVSQALRVSSIRKIILFAFLFSSCATNSQNNHAGNGSAKMDSVATANASTEIKSDSAGKTKTDSSAAVSSGNIPQANLPLFTTFPEIRKQGKSVTDFIPDGWKIMDSVSGDLNHDPFRDFVIILQHRDSVRMIDFSNDFVDTLITQPRMVMVVLYDNSSSGFRLSASNDFFIPNHDRDNMQDPFQSMTIANGILQFNFSYFAIVGSYEASNLTYKFRFENGDFELIGGEYLDYMRNTGVTDECSYDFLTKKMKWTAGGSMFDERKKGTAQWETFTLDKMRTLSTMQPPGTWEVKKGHYL